MSSAAVIARLEAVAARLEALAAGGGAGAVGGGAAAGGDAGEVAVQLKDYDAFYSDSVQPFVDAAAKIEETKYISEAAATAFKSCRTAIAASLVSKKPSDQDFLKFVQPIVDCITGADAKCDNRSTAFNQQKAWAEVIQCMSWLMMPLPRPHIVGQLEASDFYLMKVLTAAKKASGDEQASLREFVKTIKAMLNALADYVKEHFKTGLAWNPRGEALSNFKEGAPAAPAAPPAPPAPAAPAAAPGKSSGGGMGAVFGELTTKGSVTSGLKKVTRDMQTHKNPELRSKGPVPVAKKPVTQAKKWGAGQTSQKKKDPVTNFSKGTWFVEHYEGKHDLEIKDVELKHSVYLCKLRNCTVNLPTKCKSIQIDGCFKTRIIVNSVVSTLEIFNNQRLQVEVTGNVPSISIDKTSGCVVEVTTQELKKNPPLVVTSMISECNFTVPGVKKDDDPIEIPFPEQFNNKYNFETGKIDTTPMVHGD